MIGLDTNIVIRLLVNDDPVQGEQVRRLLAVGEKKGTTYYLSNNVLLEVVYVLGSVYGYTKREICNALDLLGRVPLFEFENRDVLTAFVTEGPETVLELDDLLIGLSAATAGCSTTMTFDKKAARSSLFTLIKS